MSTSTDIAEQAPARSRRRQLVIAAVAVAVVAAVALDTKVVRIGSEQDVAQAGFSPEAFGAAEFPKIRDSVTQRAVDAKTLAEAVVADKAAAASQYGVPAGIGAVIPVSFTGVVGEGKSGVYKVAVDGLPAETGIRVQTGPAINGTDLRDATGEIKFGDFKNQIEYQNAGAAINNAMKQEVLADIDGASLPGKTISVVGAFTLVNPKNWLVTPVEITVR
jgi:predicted lipoprotein